MMTCLLVVAWLSACTAFTAFAAGKPNVILIVTDDQGYGEIAAHGNPLIRTPHFDKLHGESVRLTDYHVDPTCSPTRSALMTGRYSTRAGVWHTISGRSIMHQDELTLGEVFKANGYATAMIGKWHLGDNYPFRPQDQGFERVICHLGGGLDNGPNYWGSDYFDDAFLANGTWKKYDGYCTDVWFREAARFVEEKREQPFFLYLATNAPHSPFLVAESYAAPYKAAGMPDQMAKFYGMIANLDENLGKFRAKLDELGLAENTLLIFMSDNGTTAGWIDEDAKYPYYNAGMRGWKESIFDGGHRVPCFWHWPNGGLTDGRDVPQLTAHIDLLPTLVDLLEMKKPDGPALDGISLRAPLHGAVDESGPERTLFVHVQRAFLPPKWERSAAMTERWRLVDGKELYDITADPGQQSDVAAKHPDVVDKLRGDYEAWWKSLEPSMKRTARHVLGGDENPMVLSSHDWLMPGAQPSVWSQKQIQRGDLIQGPWPVEVKQAGTYEITLHRWPPYLDKPMGVKEAHLSIGDGEKSITVEYEATHATFRMELQAGSAMLEAGFTRPDDKRHGAYFVTVHHIEK